MPGVGVQTGNQRDGILERAADLAGSWSDGNPCYGCGACCRYFRVSFYHGELDTQPGGTVPGQYAIQITPFLACMKGTEMGKGRCVAFRDDGRCAIYERRPSTCREFPALLEDGSPNPECQRLRALLGIG